MADCIVIERSHTQKSHQHIEPRVLTWTQRRRSGSSSSSSSRSSDGNSGLLDEGGSASQVPQATVKLSGYESVVWPDSLSEWLVDGAGLQQMFYCPGMSVFRFSAEFRFFFFTFRFFENHFPLFKKKVADKKKTHKKSQSPTPPLSGEFKGLATVGRVHRAPVRGACHRRESSQSSGAGARFFGFWSKFESAVSPLGTRNLTPATVRCLDEGR